MQGISYRDLRAAWREYLANDNQGHGVVLIGHSQGFLVSKGEADSRFLSNSLGAARTS